VAVPVYNGANYLAEALESILAQTLRDIEVIVVDNGSTDATREIALGFADRDPRVRYFLNGSNFGPTRSFSRAFAIATGRYFKFAPHDDLYDPHYLEKCVAVLERRPDVVLCTAHVCIVGPRGERLRTLEPEVRADMDRPSERFRNLLNNSRCLDFFGVIRKSALNALPSPVLAPYGHSDGVLLARLGLLGKFHHIAEPLYLNRDHRERCGRTYHTYKEYTYFLNPHLRGHIIFPRWRMGYEFFRSIRLFDLPAREQIACLRHMASWLKWYWPSLGVNLLVAGVDAVRLAARALLRPRGASRGADVPQQTAGSHAIATAIGALAHALTIPWRSP
jgi:glycosyltransferase involved in cell wall biosynthesis